MQEHYDFNADEGHLGKPDSTSYVAQFASRRDHACVVRQENGAEWLELTHPTQLANFVAFCKARGRRVYFRGQTVRYPTLLPSLFRAADDCQANWRAYAAFIRKLRTSVEGTRFRRRNFGAVLQHYGFRTAWLDVVDDVHTALWFALNTAHATGGRYSYARSDLNAGWIVLLSVPREINRQDLRETQSSRNTRCHVQQGWSLAMQHDTQARCNRRQDFGDHVIGTVRIPNCKEWHLEGFMASQSYFFPKEAMDDTYKQLQSSEVLDLAAQIEAQEGLQQGMLGRATLYAYPNPV